METTTRNKVLIFMFMTLVFLASVFLKQYLDTGNILPVKSTAGVVRLDSGEAVSSGEEAPAAEADGNETSEPVATVPVQIVVDVEGAVASPGVVRLAEGSRVYEAVEAAGGMTESADHGRVNLAEKVADGAAVYIPFQGEDPPEMNTGTPTGQAASSDGLININTADKSTLMQLPGIGEVYAQSIIDYRQSIGAFQKIEDIKNVSGIGDAKFERLKALITV